MDIWFSQMDTENVKTSIRVDKQLFSAASEYQRIDVFESKEFGKMIVLDGEIIFSEADEFIYNEMVVHVPMAVHPKVRNVLIIGEETAEWQEPVLNIRKLSRLMWWNRMSYLSKSAVNSSLRQRKVLTMQESESSMRTDCAFLEDVRINMT